MDLNSFIYFFYENKCNSKHFLIRIGNIMYVCHIFFHYRQYRQTDNYIKIKVVPCHIIFKIIIGN